LGRLKGLQRLESSLPAVNLQRRVMMTKAIATPKIKKEEGAVEDTLYKILKESLPGLITTHGKTILTNVLEQRLGALLETELDKIFSDKKFMETVNGKIKQCVLSSFDLVDKEGVASTLQERMVSAVEDFEFCGLKEVLEEKLAKTIENLVIVTGPKKQG